MEPSYEQSYWHDPARKAAFQRYLIEIFGLDLSLWDQLGFWDDNYRPFSLFERDRVIANVCLYTMDMMVAGKRCQVGQLSAVGTLPAWRGRGLNRRLTETALEWARDSHEFFFLFADDDAFGFYEKCGFRPIKEYAHRLKITPISSTPGVVRLDMGRPEHVALVYEYAQRRTAVSETLGVFNPKLLMYWCLYGLRDCVYRLPELDLIVLYKREDDLVTIYDIVASAMPTFAQLYPYIAAPTDRAIDFLFVPDRLDLPETEPIHITGNGTHVLGTLPFEPTFVLFPFTAHA